jgi:hypothetical protein
MAHPCENVGIACRVSVGEPAGQRQYSMPRCEDNIETDHKPAGCGGVDWIHQAEGPVVGCFEHGNVPSSSVRSREFLDKLSMSPSLSLKDIRPASCKCYLSELLACNM